MSDLPYPVELNHPDPIVRATTIRSLAERFDGEYICGRGKDFRDWLVDRANLPMSGKTVDRYLRLLETPVEVQRAVSSGKLPMRLAIGVAHIASEYQQEIVYRIEAGEDAKAVVTDVIHRLTKSTLPAKGTPAAEYRQFLLTAVRTLRAVEGHEDNLVDEAMEAIKAAEILGQTIAFAEKMRRKEIASNE